MEFTTDGASLPLFFRRFVTNRYPKTTIVKIDRAGVFHDLLTHKYPKTPNYNRKRFVKLLKKYKIDIELIYAINLALWLFDISPDWLQKKMKQTTKPNTK